MKLLIATAVLSAASVYGQDAPPASPDTSGGQDAPASDEYGGPTVLSRGGGPSIGNPVSDIRLRPFVTLNGIYDSGLGNTILNEQGSIPYVSAYGIETIFGATGTRRFRQSTLDLDYRGSFRHYSQNSYYDGMDNSLTLGYKRNLSAHTVFSIEENAARYQRAYSLPLGSYYNNGSQSYDPTFSGITGNDFFDTPTTALMSTAQLVHEKSRRLSFGISGSGFIVRRRAQSLIGSNGYTARGDMAYRLTRYQTLSVQYTFTHFDFQSQFGQSDMHGATLSYSVRIGRALEIALEAGAFRVESLRLDKVVFDPVIAKLLGQPYAFEKAYNVRYIPQGSVRITRRVGRNTALSAGYDRTVLAGNGIYTTSGFETAQLGYSYAGVRRMSIQAGLNYSRYSALMQNLGRYRGYSAGIGLGYQLGRGLSLVARADARRYYVSSSALNRVYERVQIGFGWSPGEYPLSIW